MPSPVPVRKRPIGDDGRGRRGGGGGGGPARGCRARAPPPRPDPEAIENVGKGPVPGSLATRERASGRPTLDGKALPPHGEGPDERGCLCTLLPRGAKDAQPHRPSSSDGDALPPSSPSPAKARRGWLPTARAGRARVGERRSGMGLTGVNHLRAVPLPPPPRRGLAQEDDRTGRSDEKGDGRNSFLSPSSPATPEALIGIPMKNSGRRASAAPALASPCPLLLQPLGDGGGADKGTKGVGRENAT